jgi:hypothetical protein
MVLCGSLAMIPANMEAIEATMQLEVRGANGFQEAIPMPRRVPGILKIRDSGPNTERGGESYAASIAPRV